MKSSIPSVEILGNRVHMVQIPEVLEIMSYWIEKEREKTHWIVVTGMHGIMEAHQNKKFKEMLNSADLWVPDSISVVWIARYLGVPLKKRVAGPDLMWEFMKLSNQKGYKNFFYGDTLKTLQSLKNKLFKTFPSLKISYFSPPFRVLTDEEEEKNIEMINQNKPDVLWVGLGLPKQENWIFKHRSKLKVPVVIGIGAAFKLLSGEVKRAPTWVGNLGLEWLWRFFQEPRKLWRRVLLGIPGFILLVLFDLIKNKEKIDKEKS